MISNVSTVFTLVMLVIGVNNIFFNDATEFGYTILQVFAFIVLLYGVSELLTHINFKRLSTYVLVEFIIMYPCFLLAGYFLNWYSWHLYSFIIASARFILIFFLTVSYEIKRNRAQAEEINRIINSKTINN